MRTKAAIALFATVILVNVAIAVFVFVSTRDRDLSIPETVIDFQQAVYGGNYEAMWDLSVEPYRSGLDRQQFIDRARDTAPPLTRINDWTVLDEHSGEVARAYTRMELATGDIVTHSVELHRVDNHWRVSDYSIYSGDWPPPVVVAGPST